jgi:uncharacterized membrane protein YfhO
VQVLADVGPDGRVVAVVDSPAAGVLFFSEPYYAERRAVVDGEMVDPVVANVAFTALPLPAGRHEVELRYTPRRFYTGMIVSAITLLGWAGVRLAVQPRRAAAPATVGLH